MTRFDYTDIFVDFINNLTPGLVIQFFSVSLVLFYFFFAFALWRQIQLMSKVVEVDVSPLLNILGALHLLSTIGLFLLGIIML